MADSNPVPRKYVCHMMSEATEALRLYDLIPRSDGETFYSCANKNTII
jgi:hypothetical protein